MGQKIYVCLKQVPDTEARFKLGEDNKSIDLQQVKWVVNPYDEYAIEEAIKIKSSFADSQIFVLTVGPKERAYEALRTALAMGADEAICIDSPSHTNLNPLDIAKALADTILAEGPLTDVVTVLAGKVSIDQGAGLVPSLLAQLLNLPLATMATKISWSQGMATVTRELEGSVMETLEVGLPAMITCNKGLNTPRYPSLPGIMKAKKKIIKDVTFFVEGASPFSSWDLSKMELPPERPQVTLLSGDTQAQVKELVKKLREESKVI